MEEAAGSSGIRVLAVRLAMGRIEVVLHWRPAPLLLAEAAGGVLCLASRVSHAAEGPRALPGRGPQGNLAVLPLEIPAEAGAYRVRIEPLVEHRFWASERGFVPLELEIVRRADGAIRVCLPSSGHAWFLAPGEPFRIDTPCYGLDDSERAVEIPWVLARYRGEARVLDAGHAYAEPRYVERRNALAIPLPVGLDMAVLPQPGILGVAGDVRTPPFRSASFDLVLALSFIEHVGRDNSRYFTRCEAASPSGDLEAARSLFDLVRPGGRLLVTVPFGCLEDRGSFLQYDAARVDALVAATGGRLTLAEYYGYQSTGWVGPVAREALKDAKYVKGSRAAAVACLELTRPPL